MGVALCNNTVHHEYLDKVDAILAIEVVKGQSALVIKVNGQMHMCTDVF